MFVRKNYEPCAWIGGGVGSYCRILIYRGQIQHDIEHGSKRKNFARLWTHKRHHTLRWLHNERDGASNHQPHDCLLNGLCRRISKKTSKLRVTCLFAGNSPVTGEIPAQRVRNAENVSIWWRHQITRPYGRGMAVFSEKRYREISCLEFVIEHWGVFHEFSGVRLPRDIDSFKAFNSSTRFNTVVTNIIFRRKLSNRDIWVNNRSIALKFD